MVNLQICVCDHAYADASYPCLTDFAISIKSAEDLGNCGENAIPLRGRREGRTWMF
jgi:hypothetical protein